MSETAKEKVLKVYPHAWVHLWGSIKSSDAFTVCLSRISHTEIGRGFTDEAAWEDAASKLPQQDARATAERLPGMDNCPSCDGCGAVGRERMEEACDACLGTGKRSAKSPRQDKRIADAEVKRPVPVFRDDLPTQTYYFKDEADPYIANLEQVRERAEKAESELAVLKSQEPPANAWIRGQIYMRDRCSHEAADIENYEPHTYTLPISKEKP